MKLKYTNKKYTQIAIYVIIVAIIIDILKFVLGYTPEIFVFVVEKLSWLLKVIKPVTLGFVFAYLIEPLVDFLEHQFKKIKIFKRRKGTARTYAITCTLLIILIAASAVISLLVFSVTDQLRVADFEDVIVLYNRYMQMFTAFSDNISQRLTALNIKSVELADYVKGAGTYVLNVLKGFAGNLVGSVSNLSDSITTFIFALVIAIYFLSDGNVIKLYLSKVFRALFSNNFNRRMKELIKDADKVFSGYIRGQLLDALVMMILISISLSLVGVKFAVVIGVIAGAGNIIPYFGPIVAYFGTALVCLLNGEYKQLIFAVIALLIIQTIDGNIIGPRLLSGSINIHPLLVLIFLIFGSAMGGLLGMLLAVPVGAFLKVLFVKFIDNRLEAKEQKKIIEEEE